MVADFAVSQTLRDQMNAEGAVEELLRHIGEDPTRDGLLKTPARLVRALKELTQGYGEDPAEILSTRFDVDCDEMIIVKDIEFYSTCEHHILPFYGKATVAYIPTESVVGLSKLVRLVQCFAKRLQIQERMTNQIADAMAEHLKPTGVGVLVTATHFCMAMRGVRQSAVMETSALRGAMLTKPEARHEFLSLARTGR